MRLVTEDCAPLRRPGPLDLKAAMKLQKSYASKRRAWARAVGRPYAPDEDPRPPPGELDAGPDE
jgi:hypothetical protein